eukprot:1617539-Prymnesium_polylepis.1
MFQQARDDCGHGECEAARHRVWQCGIARLYEEDMPKLGRVVRGRHCFQQQEESRSASMRRMSVTHLFNCAVWFKGEGV